MLSEDRKRLLARLRNPSQFVKDVGNTATIQILSLIISIGNAVIIARWLGPDGKGVVQLALLVPAILGLFLNGGIGVANVYYSGNKQFDVPTLTANASAFTLIGTLVGLVLFVALFFTNSLAVILQGVPPWLLLFALVGFPIALFTGYLSTILQGLQQIYQLNWIRLSGSLTLLLATLIAVAGFGLGIFGAVAASIISTLVTFILLIRQLKKHGASFRPKYDWAVMGTTLKFGMRGYVGNVLQFFNYRLDVFIVNFFLGPASVGIYSVSVRLAELVWYFPNAVGFVIFPKAASSSRDQMNRFTPQVFRTTLIISLILGVGIALVGKQLINFVYTSAFSDAFLPMLVLLPGAVLLGTARVLTNDIAGRGYPQYNSISSGLSLVLTIVFDLLFIPKLGILGAALASSLSYLLTFVSAMFFYWKIKDMPSGSV